MKIFSSIKAKVSLLCITFILIAVAVNSTIFIKSSSSTITDNTEYTLQDLANAYQQNLTNTINKINESTQNTMEADALNTYISTNGIENITDAQNFITMYSTFNTDVEEINLVNASGIVLLSSNSENIGKNISEETYFTEMMSTSNSTQSSAFTSESSGETCITFANPVYELPPDMAEGVLPTEIVTEETTTEDSESTDEQEEMVRTAIGAIVINMKVSALSDTLSNISVNNSDSSYAYLMDSNGTVLYHPNEELIGQTIDNATIQNLVSQVQQGSSDTEKVITYSYEGEEHIAGVNINDSNNWILVITAQKEEILSSLNELTLLALIVSIVLVGILALFAYLFAGTITKPIKKITALINQTASLDLQDDSSYTNLENRKDETGEMSRSIKIMRQKLHEMILQIGETSKSISNTATQLNEITQDVNDFASDNSAIAEELSASMEETAATTEVISTNIDQVGRYTNEITAKSMEGTTISTALIDRAVQLKSSTEQAVHKTKLIFSQVKEQTNQAIEKSKSVEKINFLTKTINEIANQTNLLSLNASIEAARAGDAGKGFSVVANEIGTLADQSASTVSSINDIVQEVHQAVESMTTSLEQTLEFLENNVLVDYQEFTIVSDQYNNDALSMNETMQTIQMQIESANENMNSISTSISEINAMVGEATAGICDVAGKNTSIVSLTTKTYDMVKENTDYAEKLKEMVEKFKL